jgi:protein tyrosine/serine phosphatase
MIYTIRWCRWLIGPLLTCAVVLGIAVPGCQYWAGPLPLGVDNDVRATSSLAPSLASSRWAQPMELPGLPNLHKVSDSMYRGAAPTAEGIRQLKKLGIKTVVDLRDSGSPDDLRGTGMTYVRIPTTAWQPDEKAVVRFLQTVTDTSRLPVFVHCQRGADRTGMMCAIYRVAMQGWSKDQAIEEMTHGGFGFYSGWQNLVRYVRDLDIERIKQSAVTTAPRVSVAD